MDSTLWFNTRTFQSSTIVNSATSVVYNVVNYIVIVKYNEELFDFFVQTLHLGNHQFHNSYPAVEETSGHHDTVDCQSKLVPIYDYYRAFIVKSNCDNYVYQQFHFLMKNAH